MIQNWNLTAKLSLIWVKVFKNGPSKNCEGQPLKNLKWYGLLRQTISNFLKTVFHKFYLVQSWIPWPIYTLITCTNKRLNVTQQCQIYLTWLLGEIWWKHEKLSRDWQTFIRLSYFTLTEKNIRAKNSKILKTFEKFRWKHPWSNPFATF